MGLPISVLIIAGVGGSEGDFQSETTLTNRTRNLLAVYAFARCNFDLGDGLGLFGSSMGGATCLNAFANLRPRAIVTVAAPVASADIVPRNDVDDPNLVFLAKENKSFNLQPKLAEINHILVVHGTNDEIVPYLQSRLIFEAAQEPKKLLLLTGADHTISATDQQIEFMQASVEWFRKHLAP